MYNIDNFIIPVNFDNILKIRNINNIITHIIKDPYCTVIQQSNALVIKQKGDANSIKLIFLPNTDITLAHNILRDELAVLAENIKPIEVLQKIRKFDFNNNYIYCGTAIQNSLETDEVWFISRKIINVNGSGENAGEINNVNWTDRYTHNYI